MTATTTSPTPTDLLPYIRAAYANVGARRTDTADVARILRAHGATSTAAEIMIRDRITATLPPCPAPDPARLARYQAERDRSGLDLPAFCYMWEGPAI